MKRKQSVKRRQSVKKIDKSQKDCSEDASEETCNCKVSRNTTKYGFVDLYKRLPNLWLGNGYEEHSLRELRDKINVRILRTAVEGEGEETVVGEIESKYDVLTSEEYTAGEKTEVENSLISKGVDIREVREDFVSHQSVANHFYDCLNKKKGKSSPHESNDVRNVRSLKRMAKDRLEQMVEKHRKTGDIDVSDEYRIETDFYIVDEEGNRTEVAEVVKKAR
jgi:hypothetical protein